MRGSPYVGNSTPIIRRLFGIDPSNDRPPSFVTIIRLIDEPLVSATLESISIMEVAQMALPQWAIGRGGSDEKRVVTIILIVASYGSPARARATECFK